MSAPTFAKLNGQIKTAWRWYDAYDKLAELQHGCEPGTNECPAPCILSAPDRLPPFQFARPSTVLGITSWRLFNNDGVEVLNLDSAIGLIDVQRFASMDYVIYPGTLLPVTIDAGIYYSRIVTNGATYYSDPVRVLCAVEGENIYPESWKDTAFYSPVNNPSGTVSLGYQDVLVDTITSPGPPSNPAWEAIGINIGNIGDSLLYTWNGSAWVSSTPADGTWFFWQAQGYWFRYSSGAWTISGNSPSYTYPGGVGWQGPDADGLGPLAPVTHLIPINLATDGCAYTGNIRITVTVSGYQGGTLRFGVGTLGVATGNGEWSMIANGPIPSYLSIFLEGSADFYGEVTKVEVRCLGSVDQCFRRLAWGSCGNVGNTYFAGGFMDSFWLDADANPMMPVVSNRVESEEQADGTVVETFRRKEVRYSMRLGLLPWPAADALSDVALCDTVRLYHKDGTYDTLRDVQVAVNYDEAVSECTPQVDVSFRIDNSAVACCDDFDRPCLEPCTTADGFDTALDAESGVYVDDDAPRYGTFTDGELQGSWTTCDSGLLDIRVLDIGALDTSNRNIDTHIWDPGLGVWVRVALITDVDNTLSSGDCLVTITATVMDGYAGVLQYWSNSEQRWLDTDLLLTADEWAAGGEPWIHINDALYVRLKVVVGDCVVGYSQAWEGALGCS